MATITINAKIGATNITHYGPMMRGYGAHDYAPYVYVDSGTPLGALTSIDVNTTYALGDKKLPYASTSTGTYPAWYGYYYYLECTVGGTTTASYSGMSFYNGYWTWGTAQFKQRRFHGWSKAKSSLHNAVRRNTGVPQGSSGNAVLFPCTVLVASDHVEATGNTTDMIMDDHDDSTYYTWVGYGPIGHTIISVDPTPTIPTTFQAGATCLNSGDTAKKIPAMQNYTGGGMVRGLTLGHDNTTGATTNYKEFDWNVVTRYVDCTFQVYQANTAGSFAHKNSGRHSLRCTYKSLHATDSLPVIRVGGISAAEWISCYEIPSFVKTAGTATITVAIS